MRQRYEYFFILIIIIVICLVVVWALFSPTASWNTSVGSLPHIINPIYYLCSEAKQAHAFDLIPWRVLRSARVGLGRGISENEVEEGLTGWRDDDIMNCQNVVFV